MKSNPRKQTQMCKCANLQKLDIQHDENEFFSFKSLSAFPVDKQASVAGKFPSVDVLLIMVTFR